jgi:hypothetical protein
MLIIVQIDRRERGKQFGGVIKLLASEITMGFSEGGKDYGGVLSYVKTWRGSL